VIQPHHEAGYSKSPKWANNRSIDCRDNEYSYNAVSIKSNLAGKSENLQV